VRGFFDPLCRERVHRLIALVGKAQEGNNKSCCTDVPDNDERYSHGTSLQGFVYVMYENRQTLEIPFSPILPPVMLSPTILPVTTLMPFCDVPGKRDLFRKKSEGVWQVWKRRRDGVKNLQY
jgi:hypothetical protein